MIAFHRGDQETARLVLRGHGYPGHGQVEEAAGYELLVLLLARVLEADGDVAGAAKALLGLFDVERSLGLDAARLWPGPECVRLALAAGSVGAAREVADDLAAVAARAGTASGRGAAAHARGLVDDDPEAMADAADEFHAAGRPLDEILACDAAGARFAERGNRNDAVVVLDRALALTETIGASALERRMSAALRDLGVRRGLRGSRTRPRTGWASLTDAERTVADVVADGLTNAQIGDRLYVSRRTVSTHLARIFVQLGIGSRVELAAEVLRQRT